MINYQEGAFHYDMDFNIDPVMLKSLTGLPRIRARNYTELFLYFDVSINDLFFLHTFWNVTRCTWMLRPVEQWIHRRL